jgi:drug/metabolite transporter (DMT)-like permease
LLVQDSKPQLRGIIAAFLTPLLLGVAPIFGKLAITAGADPFSVAAVRTIIAVAFLWAVYAIFARKFIYIYPAGLLGCVVLGGVNGIGSLFYYSGLGLLDASLTQLLNGMYLVFAVLMTRIGGERFDRRMGIRILLALLALIMLTGFGNGSINWLGVGLMLGSALMFAGTMILSQYVLYEMPSPTVTLYTLTTMGVVVTMAWLATGVQTNLSVLEIAMPPILILGVTTALSRLAMFAGVKFLGSLQTAILAITEIGVALALAFFILDERLTGIQVIGVGILTFSILLVRPSDLISDRFNPGKLVMQNIATQQFQWIAFQHAFAKKGEEGSNNVMAQISTAEIQAIRDMMGVDGKPIDPFPINSPQGYSVDLTSFLKEANDQDAPPAKQESGD